MNESAGQEWKAHDILIWSQAIECDRFNEGLWWWHLLDERKGM